jgi:hypothetical protein
MTTPNDWLYKSAAIMRQYRNGELKNQLGNTVINRGEAITIALAEQKRTNGDRAKEAARTENADALDKVAQLTLPRIRYAKFGGFLVQRPAITTQDVSNVASGRISLSVLLSQCPWVAFCRILSAALASLSATYPQWGQTWVLTLNAFLTCSPQLEQFWLV